MRRISIVGNAGSGKTTLAREMGRRLGLPVLHLDRHFWRPGWKETPRPEWKEIHRGLIAGDTWIVDGNYGSTTEDRLLRSDTAVFLDLPRPTCLLSVLRRSIRHRGRARPDLDPDCPEHLPDRDFLSFIWGFPSRYRPGLLERLAAFESRGGRVVRLRSRRETRRFLANLPISTDLAAAPDTTCRAATAGSPLSGSRSAPVP